MDIVNNRSSMSIEELSANLTAALDRVRAGEHIVVKRDDERIATIGPPAPRGVMWSELAEGLRNVPPPDEDFAKDVEEFQEKQGVFGENRWRP